MAATDTSELHLGEEVRRFLERLPRSLRRGRLEDARRACDGLVERIPPAAATAEEPADRPLLQMAHELGLLRGALSSGDRASLRARYDAAAIAYERWVKAKRAGLPPNARVSLRLGSLKPLKAWRTWFHILSGLAGVTLYQFVLDRRAATGIIWLMLLGALSVEVLRRASTRFNNLVANRVLRWLIRPSEREKTSSATWYLVALALLVPLLPRPAVIAGLLVLALADPAAAWFGARWGRWRANRDKSLAGSGAFVIVGILAAGAFLVAFYPSLPLERRLAAAVAAAVVGAVAEYRSRRVDDNFTVPIASSLAAWPFVAGA